MILDVFGTCCFPRIMIRSAAAFSQPNPVPKRVLKCHAMSGEVVGFTASRGVTAYCRQGLHPERLGKLLSRNSEAVMLDSIFCTFPPSVLMFLRELGPGRDEHGHLVSNVLIGKLSFHHFDREIDVF